MSASFDAVDEKLREVDFFLTKLSEAGIDCAARRYYFSAFVSAARSVTFALQHAMEGIEGFPEWYAVRQDQFRSDDLCRYFKAVRNEVQKRGTNPVSIFEQEKDGKATAYFIHCYGDPEELPPNQDVESASRSYMTLLAQLVYETYRDFGHFIDPTIVYSPEGASRRGLSIEDIEEEVIGVRGWTSGLPLEERFRLLRQQEPMPHIDDILIKYLGHDRFGQAANE